ncbi:MAG: hypothetical protein GQF41_4530 [Candidatus Rifleibacterium amylolyticum]|nr:MAG: hypothetical protein GQF41_4530 [Candidatus Rifleibacterium amylolyticum]
MKADKRTSNLFIAGGYCLVAIIILLNYLSQAEVKDKTAVKSGDLHSAPADESALSRQLKEEKRVNMEMREMLTRLQGLISDPHRLPVQKSGVNIQQASGRYDIPDINYDLLEAERPRSNPFIPGKNPFAMATKTEAEVKVDNRGLSSSLRCDPKLPFIIRGSGLHSGFISNF